MSSLSLGTQLASASSSAITTVNKKKRQQSFNDDNGESIDEAVCCFCAQNPAVLTVKLPVLGRKKRADMPYCLRCYYTSSAVRQGKQNVSILNSREQERQLPAIQTLFSDCFLELQQDISKASLEALSQRPKNHDPLAALLGMSTKSKPNKRLEKKKAGNIDDGGFLRNVDIPERLKQTQHQQARSYQQQMARMEQLAGSNTIDGSASARRNSNVKAAPTNRYASSTMTTTTSSLSNRRKGSRKSIWNLAMDPASSQSKEKQTAVSHISATQEDENTTGITCTSCGSKSVKSFGNITSRNGDVRKGEIWGTDRDSTVVTRYQCNNCGRTWNEEE